MTAQVFRNGQQPTFYVSDALSPTPGGGIDGTFQNLTVTNATSLGAAVTSGLALMVRKTVANTSPIEVRGTTNDIANGMLVTQVGFPPTGQLAAFGANTSEANPAAYAYAYAGVDLKFGAGNAELLRLKNTGIAASATASNVLALQPGNTTIFTNTITSGVSTPSWVTLAGWTAPATVLNITWQRIGNIVTCWGVFSSPASIVGINTSTITLPVARTSGAFTGVVAECLGIVNFLHNTNAEDAGSIAGTVGSTTTATITVNGQAPASPGVVSVSFAYQL